MDLRLFRQTCFTVGTSQMYIPPPSCFDSAQYGIFSYCLSSFVFLVIFRLDSGAILWSSSRLVAKGAMNKTIDGLHNSDAILNTVSSLCSSFNKELGPGRGPYKKS